MITRPSATGLLAAALILSGCTAAPLPVQPTASSSSSSTVSAAQSSSATQETTAAPSGLRAGDTFKIVLKSNPTTGYGWTSHFNDALLEKLDDSFMASDAPGLVGVGGYHVFTFKALASGTSTLRFDYARPWEKDVDPIESKTFEITAK